MPPSKRNPSCDRAIARVYTESGFDVTYTANHFLISEKEVYAAVLADLYGMIPRKPPTPAKGLFVVPKKVAA